MKKIILITGVAGFIGFHLCKSLLEDGEKIISLDNLNNYYDKKLKKDRLKELESISENKNENFRFYCGDLNDLEFLRDIFKKFKPSLIFHLAAQAGVRYSLKNPSLYLNSNILGFGNLLECCKEYKVEHLLYASSSSVYGGNKKVPFAEKDSVDNPVSLYAATKKANELMAHSYSHLYEIPSTGLRFFTVYGPWGRPDMAPMIFTKSIVSAEPLRIFNKGDMFRDFTYIDDVIKAIIMLSKKIPNKKNIKDLDKKRNPSEFYRIVNIGNNNPVNILKFVTLLENELGIKAIKDFAEMQPGDVKSTFADTNLLSNLIQFKPNTPLESGVKTFIKWYKDYYKIDKLKL